MKPEKAATSYFPEDRRPDPEVLLMVSPWVSELFDPDVWNGLSSGQKQTIFSVTNCNCREDAYAAYLEQTSLLSRMILGINGNGNGDNEKGNGNGNGNGHHI
jgi:hypothetical protein